MKVIPGHVREGLASNLWLVPAVMIAASAVLAYGAVWLDESRPASHFRAFEWLITTDLDGARVLLSVIASSMIGVAGVVFSITVVVLSLAAGQLGPRLLRSFMRQNTIRFALGTYLATFLFCLLLLIRLQVVDDDRFIPNFSMSLAVVFAVACVGVLVYYIHHIAVFIQADSVISDVSRDLDETVEAMFPCRLEETPTESTSRPPAHEPGDAAERVPIRALREGYIQSIDVMKLVTLAKAQDLMIAMRRRTGAFVICNTALADAWPAERIDDTIVEGVDAAVSVGKRPTTHDDVEFAIRQLVEVAVRALSPGINDPFTAIACVDKLTSALGRLIVRAFPSAQHRDEEGRLRVITDPVSFPHLLDTAFNQIRQNARGTVSVSIRMLEAIALLAPFAQRYEDRVALRTHADEIYTACRAETSSRIDQDELRARYEDAIELLPQERDSGAQGQRAD